MNGPLRSYHKYSFKESSSHLRYSNWPGFHGSPVLLSKLTNDVDVVDDHTIQSNLFARTNPFDAIINWIISWTIRGQTIKVPILKGRHFRPNETLSS